MNFSEAEKFLDELVSYERKRDFDYSEKSFDLVSLKSFLDTNGVDYSNFKIVHVAGSKGKGTVSSLVANYIYGFGKKVGLFTSPHIFTVRERILANGGLIPEDRFVFYVEELSKMQGVGARITYFEALFVIALMFFKDEGCEYVVLEVGLGGRLDATNVVNSDVSVLMPVELEHRDLLGDTLGEIVNEKIAIRKNGEPFVVAKQSVEVYGLVYKKFNDAIFVKKKGNIPVVREILSLLFEKVDEVLLKKISNNHFMLGHFDVRQIGGHDVVFDVAHTVNSFSFLLNGLKNRFPKKNLVFLLSFMRDKDVSGILSLVFAVSGRVYFTSSNIERGFFAKDLKRISLELGFDDGVAIEDCYSAFGGAIADLGNDDLLVVSGSHFLVSMLLASF